jgi:hypothetical protein
MGFPGLAISKSFAKSPNQGKRTQININPVQLVKKISTAKIHPGTETYIIICTPKSTAVDTLITAETGHVALVQRLQNHQTLCINLVGSNTYAKNSGIPLTREISAANLRDTMQELGAKLKEVRPGMIVPTSAKEDVINRLASLGKTETTTLKPVTVASVLALAESLKKSFWKGHWIRVVKIQNLPVIYQSSTHAEKSSKYQLALSDQEMGFGIGSPSGFNCSSAVFGALLGICSRPQEELGQLFTEQVMQGTQTAVVDKAVTLMVASIQEKRKGELIVTETMIDGDVVGEDKIASVLDEIVFDGASELKPNNSNNPPPAEFRVPPMPASSVEEIDE